MIVSDYMSLISSYRHTLISKRYVVLHCSSRRVLNKVIRYSVRLITRALTRPSGSSRYLVFAYLWLGLHIYVGTWAGRLGRYL